MSQPQQDLTGLGEIHALLGRGTSFEGTLAFEGRVRIDGTFKGQVFSDGILILGDGAEVEAQIEVGTLIVRGGTLRGNVVARQLIEIHAEGAVHGDITAPTIDIDKGCVFEGKCTMAKAADPTSSAEMRLVSSSEMPALMELGAVSEEAETPFEIETGANPEDATPEPADVAASAPAIDDEETNDGAGADAESEPPGTERPADTGAESDRPDESVTGT